MSLEHKRAVGDTLSKLAIQLTREGVPVNLTGYTVTFIMTDASGNIIVNNEAATVSNATIGYVEYDFQAGEVAVAGDYRGWFTVLGTGEPDTYPADPNGIHIELFDPSSPTEEVEEDGFSTTEFMDLASAPKRTRTLEGTVEERSIDDLIKADRWAKSQNLDSPPWGIRVARTKPPGTTG